MKKIGIVTLHGYSNYGNRLQNYATQETLKKLGYYVESIKVESGTPPTRKKSGIKSISKYMHNIDRIWSIGSYEKIGKMAYRLMHRQKIRRLNEVRTDAIKRFSERYISESKISIQENEPSYTIGDKFDYFITGSDQVWNPGCISRSSTFFLDFAPMNKRISFAPSFGVSEIPPELRERYIKGLSGLSGLSVREYEGAQIIKQLIGKDAEILVDPTLLLTKEEWLSVSKINLTKRTETGGYILTYFLGDVSKETRRKMYNIGKENDLEIINLLDINDPAYVSSPSDFLQYINSAKLVCTDSFHGSVFSMLFETPFIVFNRSGTSIYSRIETLLSKFGLQSRKCENIVENKQIFEVDFSGINLILEQEREKSFRYLQRMLNEGENFKNSSLSCRR